MRKVSALIALSLLFSFAKAEVVYVKYIGSVDISDYSCSAIDSSFIHELCFSESNVKVIALLNDTYYQYCGIESQLFNSWLDTQSKGSFYNKYIKGRYRC